MWETWVPSLGQEDLLEKGMATHSSILAWRIPMDRGSWWTTVHRIAKSWILYIENPKDSTRKLLELVNDYSKVAGYKITLYPGHVKD